MDKDKLLYWGSLVAACIAITISSIAIAEHNKSLHSSPVEEMYHKQLVTTLDSVLDARFGSGCCEEVIDSDDVSIPHNRFGRVLAPIE